MMKYLPFELHTHTQHSDGKFLTDELVRACGTYGYRGMAITDHNAVTAADEVTPELLEETGMIVIPGIEWTTFYGHLLVLGCKRYVDWRFVTPDTIDAALEEIRETGGIAGIAHPCEVGSPLMCGCHWDFKVTRWDLVSYVELWSQEDPHARAKNWLAKPWYDALLNEGYRLAVSAGRDWHSPDPDPSSPPLLTATYLGVETEDVQGAINALRAGRTFITMGPVLTCEAIREGRTYSLGESMPAGHAIIHIQVGFDDRMPHWRAWGITPTYVRIVMNGEVAAKCRCAGSRIEISVETVGGWLRAEIWGTYRGSGEEQLLALTSPVYVE